MFEKYERLYFADQNEPQFQNTYQENVWFNLILNVDEAIKLFGVEYVQKCVDIIAKRNNTKIVLGVDCESSNGRTKTD